MTKTWPRLGSNQTPRPRSSRGDVIDERFKGEPLDVRCLGTLRDDQKTAVKNYGHVIMDECHHVGAISFDAILKRVKAKYVLGLTALRLQASLIFLLVGAHLQSQKQRDAN